MKIDNIAEINPFTLRFQDDALECAFRTDFYRKTLSQLRFNILLGVFLYGILGVIDLLIIPEIKSQAWLIRYGIACPVAFVIFLLTFTRHFRKMMQPLLIFGGIVGSAGAIGLNLLPPPPVTLLYFTGILLCLIFFYTFVGMRFTTSSILSWSTFLLYEFAIRWKSGISAPVHIHNTLVLLACNLTGMWGSYLREWYMLSDFVHRSTILQQQEKLNITLREVEEARREAEESSRLDPLTNIYNRRHFLSLANHELERANRHPSCLSLIMLDIDHFKRINDTHGHHVGDRVLLTITEITNKAVRRSDIVCRYGGEEFVILLPETDTGSALNIADRLRESIEHSGISAGNSIIRVTASIGIATLLAGTQGDVDELIKRADQALYKAKLEGRNQVKIWDPEEMGTEFSILETASWPDIAQGRNSAPS